MIPSKIARLIFITLFISTLPVNALARNISGAVYSETDSTAIIGASCRLYADSTFIAATSTSDNGNFNLNTNVNTKLRLEISMVGYNSTEIVVNNSGNVEIDKIYLTEGIALDEVTVNANLITDSRGRTIIFPSSADVKASSTSISLLQKLPLTGLEADPINRKLTVDGGTPVILINGIPSTIDDFNALQPKEIAKIEYSQITPARYADRGNSGFINITLKKRIDGGQIYVWARSAVNTAFFDANIKGSYHQGPSQFSLTYTPSWRNYKNVYDNNTQSFIGNDFQVNLKNSDRNPFNYNYHNIRIKYDYTPDENTILSATFSVAPNKYNSRIIAHTSDTYLGDYDNYNTTNTYDIAPSLDIFFKKDFNKKSSLEAQVVGTISNSDYRRTNSYTFEEASTSDYVMDVDSRRKSIISEICYNHNFSDKTTLTAGVQNTLSRSTNTYLSSDYKPVLTENNNYIYAQLGQQIGKIYLSLSSGVKLFWIKNDINKRNFIKNLSSARLSWNINQHWSINGSFQYTPTIPSLSSLTDYPQQQTPYLISNGNPDLKVAETFYYQLQFNYRIGKFSATYRSGIMDIHNSVINDITYLGNKLFLSQSVNADRYRLYINNLRLGISNLYGFGANVNLGISYYESAGNSWQHDLTSFNATFSLWWNSGPFTISYWRKIPGKYLSGHYVGKYENGDALNFEYKPNKHWTIGASWMYMFDKKGTRYPNWGYSSVSPSHTERYIENNGNMFVLSASYSVDFGSIFRTSRRSLNNSDNNSSLLKL